MVTAAFTCYQTQLNLSKQFVAIVLIAGGQDYRRALSQRRSKVVLKECFSFRILVPHSCMREGGADGTMGPPNILHQSLHHAGDELLTHFPTFFRRWPRVFQDVTENTACPTLLSFLDEHFFAPVPGGRRR
ncbi:Chaperone protein ClpB [Dissostichus eleginoides]|uniref:Chaperone protein ClpB n=1 Tax=Dissostichus eleginoides TaxID=100907 RepID=A0AAD9CAI4_DISEL|nr:Chaperone protein ClpB [Dissostichus eleginoides]